MLSPKDLLRALRNPRGAGRELNKLIHTRGGRLVYNPGGVDIFAEDWDNLVILDACRYDFFQERYQQHGLAGDLEVRYSRGAATYQFIQANFRNRSLNDTVYLSANPWYLKLRDVINSEIHHFINLQTMEDDAIEWVNEDLRVVTPGTVTRFAEQVIEEYPNKRVIIHYLQPHHPFIGPIGRRYFAHSSSSLIEVIDQGGPEATINRLREAYTENLNRALEEVSRLLPRLKGRTVVTSDHGEMLGDRHDYIPTRDFGHHRGIFNDPTVKIPWLVRDEGERKRIKAEPPTDPDYDIDQEAIDEHLRELGYKT